MNIEKSISLFEKAKQYIPGGVNSPVRAFNSVGGNPLFMSNGHDSRLIDKLLAKGLFASSDPTNFFSFLHEKRRDDMA